MESTDSLRNKIINLHNKGKSYREISSILGCSKSTISYHLKESTRNKVKERKQKSIETEGWKVKLIKKIDDFKRRTKGRSIERCTDWKKKFRTAVSDFKRRWSNMPIKNYTYKDVIEYLGGTTVVCKLTGRKIDILVDDYNLDHIIPVSRGGTNELDNMAITIPEANVAKGNMTNEELVTLCKEICEHFGYKVTKE